MVDQEKRKLQRISRRHTWHTPTEPAGEFDVEKIRLLADERLKVQEKAFTNWFNAHLPIPQGSHTSAQRKDISDLYEDLKDGILLLRLIENLSGSTLDKPSKGKLRFHWLENVEKALDYLRKKGVHLENVHAHDVVDGNQKIILGLIWQLIIKYQLTLIGGETKSLEGGGVRKSLLLWCQRTLQKYSDIEVKDFTASWSDGKALTALLHEYQPSLVDLDTLWRMSALKRLTEVLGLAEQCLGVPKLVDPNDLLSYPEEKSVMTYIGMLFRVFSKIKSGGLVAKRLEAVCVRLSVFERLVKTYESMATRLMGWLLEKTEVLQNEEFPLINGDERSKTILSKFDDVWRDIRRKKLQDWNGTILSFHAVQWHCSLYSLIPYTPPKGKSLQSIQEAWSNLESAVSKRRSTLLNLANQSQKHKHQQQKVMKRIAKLTNQIATLSVQMDQSKTLEEVLTLQSDCDALVPFIRHISQMTDDMRQQRNCCLSNPDITESLSNLKLASKSLRAQIDSKRQDFLERKIGQVEITAVAMTTYLKEVKVSADALNYQLEFHNAHSNFQFDRYHQFSKEVESYKGLVTMVTNQLSTMLEKVTSSGENSSIKQKLAAIIHDLEMAYDSLKQLCSEMEANSKRTRQRENYSLSVLKKEVDQEIVEERCQRQASLQLKIPTDSEEEDPLRSSLIDSPDEEDPLRSSLIDSPDEEEEDPLRSSLIDSPDEEIVKACDPYHNDIHCSSPESVKEDLTMSGPDSDIADFNLISNPEPLSVQDIPSQSCDDEDINQMVDNKSDSEMAEVLVANVQSEIRLDDSVSQSVDRREDTTLSSSSCELACEEKHFDENEVHILLSHELSWMSDQEDAIRAIGVSLRELEISSEDVTTEAFALLQRLQLLRMENVDHLKRIGHLDAELKEGEKINGQREFLESVSQLRESITCISEQLDREVSVCLKILDSEDLKLDAEIALNWFSEREYLISDLDPPGGSADVRHKLDFISGIVTEANKIYSSLITGTSSEDQTHSSHLSTASLPEEVSLDLNSVYSSLMRNAQELATLLGETLKACLFSEWADIFAMWMSEKCTKLKRFTVPNSVDRAEQFVIYFEGCLATTLKYCEQQLQAWDEKVIEMYESCPTFAKGIRQIRGTLEEDYTEYRDNVVQLLKSQMLQLEIRYHLFKMEDFFKYIKFLSNQPEDQFPVQTLCIARIQSEDAILERHLSFLAREFAELADTSNRLLELVPPTEIGRNILTSDYDATKAIWNQYQNGKLYKRKQLTDLKEIVQVCQKLDSFALRTEVIVQELSSNIADSVLSSRTLLNCAMKSLPVQFDNIETTSVSISEVLKEVSAILSRVDCSPSVRREVMLKTAVLKDQWEQIQLLYERRCTELNHANQMAAVVKPLETVEEWLNDLSCQFQEEKLQEDEILKDQFRDLNVLEDNLQSHESLLKELSVGEGDQVMLSGPFEVTIPNFSIMGQSLSSKSLDTSHSSFSDNSGTEEGKIEVNVVMETKAGTPLKGILKKPEFFATLGPSEDGVLFSEDPLPTSSRKRLSILKVYEKQCQMKILEDVPYNFDWDSIYGRSLYRDSPSLFVSPPHSRQVSVNSLDYTMMPIMERCFCHMIQEEESTFNEHADHVLPPPLEDEKAAGVRKVHFSDDTPRVHHYRPEGKGDLSDEDSCDSLEEEMPPHAASDLVEDFTTENSDLQPPKNGSMWGWLNKKHVPPKGGGRIRVPVGDSEGQSSLEIKDGSSGLVDDPTLLDETLLYSVGSLTSVIERHEGRLARKHVKENWNKKALKRSWKIFHTVIYQGQLMFYKDAKQALMGNAIADGLYLKSAKCCPAVDYQKRSHVFRLTLKDGSEYLFQANNETELQEWIQNIDSQVRQESSHGQYSLSSQSFNSPQTSHQSLKRSSRGAKQQEGRRFFSLKK